GGSEGAVPATGAGTCLRGAGVRTSDATGRNLARCTGVGQDRSHSAGDTSGGPAREGGCRRVPRDRIARRYVTRRDLSAHGKTKPDSHPGPPAPSYARRRATEYLRTRSHSTHRLP